MSGYPPPYRTRPLGVAVLAVLIGLLGALFLVAGLVVLLFSTLVGLAGIAFFGAGLVGGLLLFLAGVVLLVVAFGLWRLEMWALALSVIVIGLLWIADVVSGRILSIEAIVLLLLLVYLVLVRRHFV
ncbi:MAG TPA: hypothetical protein VMH78_07585 [Thermoplasmata archaeon]|nr:hypothetical protein [Thermoplasmata archaeon]